ncbi:hypothetical protein BJX70DRAFT_373160 [Aspergillus crustosus]
MASISDDEISLTSTVESEQQSEYEVETILAEHHFPDGMRYLVRWAGYSDDRSTWEPADAFDANETLLDWETKKKQVAVGKDLAFDVAGWEAQMRQLDQDKKKRKERRAAKRRKLVSLTQSRSVKSGKEMAKQRTTKPKSFSASISRPAGPGSKPLLSDRVHPARQGLSGPSSSRNPILFASSQTAPDRPKPKRPSTTDNGKKFSHLSTQYQLGKKLKNEPEPNRDRLDLRPPLEWSSMSSANTTQLGSPRLLPDSTESISNRYRAGLDLASNLDSDSVNLPKPERNEASNRPTRKDSSKSLTSDFVLKVPLRIPGPNDIIIPSEPPRWFNKDMDMYVSMYFGPNKLDIGNARLCGLTWEVRKKIWKLKKGKKIDIWFRDLCNLDDYYKLCSQVKHNDKYSNGWVEGFDDTEPNIRQAAATLWQHNLIAIAEITSYDRKKDILREDVLLAYPPHSPDFAFLEDGPQPSGRGYLNLTFRSCLGPIGWLRVKCENNQYNLTEVTNSVKSSHSESLNVITANNVKVHRSLDHSPKSIRQSPIASPTFEIFDRGVFAPSPNQTRPDFQYPVDKPGMQRPSSLSTELMDLDTQPTRAQGPDRTMSYADTSLDLKGLFRASFDITFEALANINGSEKGKANRVETVYVWYPQDSELVRQEGKLLLEFLKQYTPLSFSNAHEGDWDKFFAACTKMHGALFIHKSFVDYHKIPWLKDFLLRPHPCWNISLSQTLEQADHKVHHQRLFPHGGVILLTEDFMTRDTDATMVTLEWFLEWTKQKYPGCWKIMLRPNVMNWVLTRIDQNDAKLSKWLAICRLLRQLGLDPDEDLLPSMDHESDDSLVLSPPRLPNYGYRRANDSPDIPKDCSQEYRDADHLAEFFAGWCLVNAHRFRKFTMVTTLKPLERWTKWHHIDIQPSSKDFFKAPSFQVDYKPIWDKITGKTRSSSVSDPASNTPRTPKPASTYPSEQRSSASSTAQSSATHRYAQPYQ